MIWCYLLAHVMQTHCVADAYHAVLSMLCHEYCRAAVYYDTRRGPLARAVCVGVLFAVDGNLSDTNHAIVVIVVAVQRYTVTDDIICWSLRAQVM